MNNLKAKLNKENGFTLIEMLIVVAIIAILIAISIPFVNKALENAREATDAANERAALGAAMVEVLGENKLGGTTVNATGENKAAYKILNSKGELVSTTGVTSGAEGFNYGKGTGYVVNSAAENAGKYIEVTYTVSDGEFKTEWK